LKRSGEVFSPEQSIDILLGCVGLADNVLASTKGSCTVMVVGNTGSGKSTFMNYLAGCTLEAQSIVFTDGRRKTGVIGVAEESVVRCVAGIGHTNESQTFVPGFAEIQELSAQAASKERVMVMDCAGFNDSRGPEINIANSVIIRSCVAQATGAIPVILVNYHAFMAGRGRGLHELLELLVGFFGRINRVLANIQSVRLGVTQVPLLNNEGEPMEKSKIVEMLLDPSGLSENSATILKVKRKDWGTRSQE